MDMDIIAKETDETIYFNDYYKAKEYAEKHGLRECEYGDTGYMDGDEPLSYVAYNKSGDRFDEWAVECYYGWRRDGRNGRLKPYKGSKELIKRIYGVEIGE